MFFIRSLRVVPNPPMLCSHPINDVIVVINLVSCIANSDSDAIPPIIALLLILEDEVDESSRTASAGKVNKPLIPKNNIPKFNRLYVSDVFVSFDIELDKILHTPDDRNRYPNDPAVNFGIKFCIFGCIAISFDVEDSMLDDDVDIDEIVPILTSSNRPDNILVMVASLYPDAKYLGGDGSFLFVFVSIISSVLLVLSISSIRISESEGSSLSSATNKGNEELSRGILHPY